MTVLPGSFVHPAVPILKIEGAELDEDQTGRLREAFTIGRDRDFDQDPRFGLVVMAEIGSRALSPAVNDAGTAIATIGRLVRLLSECGEPVEPDVAYPEVFVPPLLALDMIEDAFLPIARDGAAILEVQLRLHKGLAALAAMSPAVFGEAAVAMSTGAVERSKAAGMLPNDLARIMAEAAKVHPARG